MHRRTGTERGNKLKRTKEVIDTEEEAKMEKKKFYYYHFIQILRKCKKHMQLLRKFLEKVF